MIVYLDEAWKNLRKNNPSPTVSDLSHAVIEGASKRVRSVMMTFAAMVGGMVSTTALTLIIVPLVYFMWRSRHLEGNSPKKTAIES